jgi:hypothetical protein
MNISRRKFITGAGLLIAAPAIVRASSIMPVRAIEPVMSLDAPTIYIVNGRQYVVGFDYDRQMWRLKRAETVGDYLLVQRAIANPAPA